MTNVPNPAQDAPAAAVTPARLPKLPGCGSPSTTRYEIWRTINGGVPELAGTVNACDAHKGETVSATAAADLLAREVNVSVGERVCGSGVDFTGGRPTPLFGDAPAAAPVHAPVAPAPGTQPARIRIARANMLREISRLCFAVDDPALPAPRSVRFTADEAITVELDTPTDAAEWAVVLGVAADARIEDTTDVVGGRWLLYTVHATWRGFPITVVACNAAVQQREAVSA